MLETFKKKKIDTVNNKMAKNTNLSTTEPKKTKQTGTESEIWTSHRGISVGRGKRGIGGKRYREEEA